MGPIIDFCVLLAFILAVAWVALFVLGYPIGLALFLVGMAFFFGVFGFGVVIILGWVNDEN